MKELKSSLINFIPDFEMPEEIKKYVCSKCEHEVTVYRAVVRGEEKTIDRCGECWNREQALLAVEAKKRAKAKKIKTLFDDNSLINPKLKKCSFSNFDSNNQTEKMALEQAKKYANDFHQDNEIKNLLFAGDFGVGKSHLAHAIGDQVTNNGYSCVFITLPRLITKITSTFGRNGISQDEFIQSLCEYDLVILDEVSPDVFKKNQDGYSFAMTKFFEIVDGRIGLHTVFTTNMSTENMIVTFGERTFSRLMDDCEVINITGQNRRLKNLYRDR